MRPEPCEISRVDAKRNVDDAGERLDKQRVDASSRERARAEGDCPKDNCERRQQLVDAAVVERHNDRDVEHHHERRDERVTTSASETVNSAPCASVRRQRPRPVR